MNTKDTAQDMVSTAVHFNQYDNIRGIYVSNRKEAIAYAMSICEHRINVYTMTGDTDSVTFFRGVLNHLNTMVKG